MDPVSIVLLVVALAGVWALVELALVLRRTRSAVDELDRTVSELNGTVTEARPVVAKLDGMVDELQPALSQVEPLLKQANVAVEALSADLIEVNGVLRDVSQVTGTVSSASGAVSSLTDAASDKVSKLFGKRAKHEPAPAERMLAEVPADEPESADSAAAAPEDAPAPRQYYTYAPAGEEATHE